MPNLKNDFAPNDYAKAEEMNLNFTRLMDQDVWGENLSNQTNGITKTFTVANEFLPNSLRVFLNGLRLTPMVDYLEGANNFTLTFNDAPESGSILIVDYRIKY